MNNNSTFTNVILVIVLVLLVGFGVWYFTARTGPAPENAQGGVNIDIEGSLPGGNSGSGNGGGGNSPDDDGTPDQGPGDN